MPEELQYVGWLIGIAAAAITAWRAERGARRANKAKDETEAITHNEQARQEYLTLLEKSLAETRQRLADTVKEVEDLRGECEGAIDGLKARLTDVEAAERICAEQRGRLLLENDRLLRENDQLRRQAGASSP